MMRSVFKHVKLSRKDYMLISNGLHTHKKVNKNSAHTHAPNNTEQKRKAVL